MRIRTALKIWMIITLIFSCCVIICFHNLESQILNKQQQQQQQQLEQLEEGGTQSLSSSGMMDLHSYAHKHHRQRSATIKAIRERQQHTNYNDHNATAENKASSEETHGKEAADADTTKIISVATVVMKNITTIDTATNIENQSSNKEITTSIVDTTEVEAGANIHNQNNTIASSSDDNVIRVGDIVYHHYDDEEYGWLIAKVLAIAKYSKRLRLLYLVDCATDSAANNSTKLKKVHFVTNSTSSKKYIRLMSMFKECDDDPTNVKINTTATTASIKPMHKTPLGHKLAGLDCDRFGGPSEDIAKEMVYWHDIPSDEQYISKFASSRRSNSVDDEPKYLLFEAESSGWNNVRMSMETAVVLAIATGRVLVLPPTHIWHDKAIKNKHLSFNDFFHFDSISAEHNTTRAFEMITTKEFLRREGLKGKLRNKYTGEVEYPPGDGNDYSYDDWSREDYDMWLRNVSYTPTTCSYMECIVVIPDKPGNESATEAWELQYQLLQQQNESSSLQSIQQKQKDGDVEQRRQRQQQQQQHIGVVPVNATPLERLLDIQYNRKRIFVYDEDIQKQRVINFMHEDKTRLLSHFYTYVFLVNWKDDLWIKRFVRDHLRYNDLIQCSSAKIVHAMKQISIDNGNPEGEFDSFHIRRGDFKDWYHDAFIEHPMELYDGFKDILPINTTIYIATNEQNKTFFDPLRQYYHIYFLDDFMDLIIKDISHMHHYLGMIDQRVVSKGRIFVGTYLSTFTGYIYRMRGYHAQKEHNLLQTGNSNTTIHNGDMLTSYFSLPRKKRGDMRHYNGVYGPLWAREFPHGWRDIDHCGTTVELCK